MAGMKKSPCRPMESSVAGKVSLMFWKSMPVVVARVQRGKTTHCHLRALVPIWMSVGSSLRKTAMICGANM